MTEDKEHSEPSQDSEHTEQKEPEPFNRKELDYDGTVRPPRVIKPTISIKRSLVYAGIVTVLIIMGFTYVMAQLISENSQCVTNPFIYAAKSVETSEGKDIAPMCNCQVGRTEFWFDEEGLYDKLPLQKIFNNN